jgi:hypothetical protein
MSAPLTRMSTRPSNAAKHPGIPDQKKKKRSPAEMAALRATEKATQDTRDTAQLAASSVITSVEDSMTAADEAYEQNAARPVPVKITRVVRPLRRTHGFSHVDDDDDDSMVQEG